MEKSQS